MKELIFYIYLLTSFKAFTQKSIFDCVNKIVIEDVDLCKIVSKGKVSARFLIDSDFRDTKGQKISGIKFLSSKNKLLAVKGNTVYRKGTVLSDLVVLDMKGNLLENLTNNSRNHYIGSIFPDCNGKRILYTSFESHPASKGIKDIDSLDLRMNAKRKLNLLNLDDKIDKINLDCFPNISADRLLFSKNPWSPDGNKFVFTIKKVSRNGLTLNYSYDTISYGSYVFDVLRNKQIDFIKQSDIALWLSENQILYIKNNQIWKYDLINKENKLFFEFPNTIILEEIRCTPDGKNLFIQCIYNGKYQERLLNIETKSELIFKHSKLKNVCFEW